MLGHVIAYIIVIQRFEKLGYNSSCYSTVQYSTYATYQIEHPKAQSVSPSRSIIEAKPENQNADDNIQHCCHMPVEIEDRGSCHLLMFSRSSIWTFYDYKPSPAHK